MLDSSGRTLVCSVLFLDIVGYSKKSVSEQMQLKREFNRALAKALEPVATTERVILDTGDGAAVTFLGAPEDALHVGIALRDTIDMPVRMGINLGAVRLVKDLNGHTNIVGDGINVGQRVMSFADENQLLVSRSFYEVVSCLSDEYAALFTHVGSRTDKHVRAHEVYAVVPDAPAPRRHAEPEAPAGREPEQASEARAPAPPAQIFDAGAQLIISGYSEASVQEAIDGCVASGARLVSPPSRVGNKWMATCEAAKPEQARVEEMGYTRIVTGPTREAVASKVGELVGYGAVLVHDIAHANGVWTAVCEVGAR